MNHRSDGPELTKAGRRGLENIIGGEKACMGIIDPLEDTKAAPALSLAGSFTIMLRQ
jgi:hypothetical protein